MESGDISSNQIWASSYAPGRNPEYARIRSRLDADTEESVVSWSPKDNDERPHLEVSFLQPTEITAIATQGGGDGQFVREYMVEYADSEGVKMITEEVVGADGKISEQPLVFSGQ